MVVKSKRGCVEWPVQALAAEESRVDPVVEFREHFDRRVQQFRGSPVTPRSFSELEKDLETLSQEMARKLLEDEVNRLEPAQKK
jgi:hypothetical protein